jgi:hypothetical protein
MNSEDISEATTEVDVGVDETTALLAGPGKPPAPSRVEPNEDASEDEERSLPKDQIFFLCLARMVEPLAFFCIFPFINKMIWDTGEVAKTDVGFYSGLVVSHPVPRPLSVTETDHVDLGISVLPDADVLDDTLGLGCRSSG